ncbi:hypothetical protein Y032_0023g721 [Ancylostoma ceylanicum]|uniref:Uncharacterized protein n=1 Tax=Ancylostoma ceylanicum TaxID=53326 RepID=A0A016UXP3_9BILA|nr:hypothetical protein Y032_0023g721 [Ancylostoma ceylanicum]
MMVTCVKSTSTQATVWRRSRSESEVTRCPCGLLGGVERTLLLPGSAQTSGEFVLATTPSNWLVGSYP